MNSAFAVVFITLWMSSHEVSGKKNVLFITADDLRPQINAWSGPDYPTSVSPPMVTPHLDDLASRSLVLTRAYCQYPFCSPSRTSMLTGRRPDTTKVYNIGSHWRDVGGNFTTIPQYFKENGYLSIGIGKVFHVGVDNQITDPLSWSEETYQPPTREFWYSKERSWISVTPEQEEAVPLPDDLLVGYALDTLDRIAPAAISGDQPFFLAVGILKPHLPFSCPERFFDYYPAENVSLPSYRYAPQNLPDIAWNTAGGLRAYNDIKETNFTGELNQTLDEPNTLALRRAYYACTTYIDHFVGLLMDRLSTLGLDNNTIVTFAGDHGFHLGENAYWLKNTNFEQSTHVPMLVRIPGVTDNGILTNAFAELVDLFPTLSEAAELPAVPLCPEDSSGISVCTEGTSLMPLATKASSVKSAIFAQCKSAVNSTYMGYTIRTDSYRYTEWPSYIQISDDPPEYVLDWEDIQGYELYDHTIDPEENHNRVDHPDYEATREELSVMLREGWRGMLPI